MRLENVTIPMKPNPVLLDAVIQDLQNALMTKLTWLDKAFGRAYKLVEHQPNSGKWVYPAAYTGQGEYVSLNPNDKFGNFCWFDIYDPQEVKQVTQGLPQYIFKGAIVFWFNMETIYPDASYLHTEEIKNEVVSLLTTPGIIKVLGKLVVKEVYERFENIYREYTIEKIYNEFVYSGQDLATKDKQFFMYPFGGLRVEFEMITRELCQPYII